MGRTVALAGNPNCGKTTLFNALTGMDQHVGNWPGVTVEKREAPWKNGEGDVRIVDLPGIYSLNAFSVEERVARDFVDDAEADVILNVADAACLERSLYLTLQLIERGARVLLVLNMIDAAEKQGLRIDTAALSRELGAPVAAVSARTGRGIAELEAELRKMLAGKARHDASARLVGRYEPDVRRLMIGLAGEAGGFGKAAALIAGDMPRSARQQAAIEGVERAAGCDAFTALAKARYEFIERALAAACRAPEARRSADAAADRLALHPLLAWPMFMLIIAAIFFLTFGPPGAALRGIMERVTALVSDGAQRIMSALDSPEWAGSLVVDGVVAGVGGVLTFLPQVLTLFMCMTVLEESGYMARAAFITDRLLRALGLSGRAFMPMLMGLGCTATAATAARAVDNERERRLTVMLTPFMSCGAKLPVYALIASAFFPHKTVAVVGFMYILGAGVMLVCGGMLSRTLFRTGDAPFMLELGEYRMPMLKAVARRMAQRAGDFMARAGTLIFAMSVFIWLLTYFTPALAPARSVADSLLGTFGGALSGIFEPLGFGNAALCGALAAGLAAKEAIISTLQVAMGTPDAAALSTLLPEMLDAPSAMAFLTFILLYTPCVSALATMRRELGSDRLLAISVVMQLGTAYVLAFIVRAVCALFM